MTPEFKKQWFRKKAHELPADAELVSCMPLSLVLEMFGISQIDFFSLDVEVMHSKQLVLKEAPMSLPCRPSQGHLFMHNCCVCHSLDGNRKTYVLFKLGSWVNHSCSQL